jgi:glycosyltransferase involved in cell wall biosynthesis
MIKLSIVIPAYNEAKTIRRLIEKILEVEFELPYEIIVVDDSSTDRTPRILRLLNEKKIPGVVRILRNAENRGKGYCLQRGFREAQGDVIIVQDADFEYDPQDIPSLLKPLKEGQADVVYGSRFLSRGWPRNMAMPNYVANRMLTWLTNFLFRSRLTDMETCYKVLRRSLLDSIPLRATRFDFEPEITGRLLKRGVRILEQPISYCGRSASDGKKIKAKDFFRAVAVLFQIRFS